jgi:hypothetical protein
MGNKGNIRIQYQHGFIIVANSSSINFFVFPAREEKKKKKRSKGDCQAERSLEEERIKEATL